MAPIKTKKQKAQKSVPYEEKLNLNFIKTVQKQLNLKIKQKNHVEKYNIDAQSLRENHKEFIKQKINIQ